MPLDGKMALPSSADLIPLFEHPEWESLVFSERAFFTFVRLTDPTVRAQYNDWHHLDHRPENLALPGVAWGDRWVRSADCVEVTTEGDPMLRDIDYVAMYWFREPYEESITAWNRLGEDSFRWGRGPQFPGVERPLRGFYAPVRGYVAPRVLVSADVLPFRPNRGLQVTLSRFADVHGPGTHAQYMWYDRVRIPDLLKLDGVAGAWTLSLESSVARPWAPDVPEFPRDSLRLRILYLDGDPVEVVKSIEVTELELDTRGRGAPNPEAEEVLVSFPVRSISPWSD